MSIATLIGYLIGGRTAIFRIASTPQAVWLGALFVLGAGFAREYDRHDLTREPWHLMVPFAASLATSLLLFCLVYVVGRLWRTEAYPFWPSYRSFLSLYWMTAPLAWLYAIPVERFLSLGDATRFNLAMLAIVSLWRVVLMARVIEALFGAGRLQALWLVMLLADSVALLTLYLTPLPMINIMGGIPLSESEELISGTAVFVGFAGILSWPVWLVGTITIFATRWRSDLPSEIPQTTIDRKLWALAVLAIVGWLPILPMTQSEQRLRYDVESAMRDDRIAEAVEVMSAHDRGEFPPDWTPPPRLAYENPQPKVQDVLDVIATRGAAPWVREIYLEKLELILNWVDDEEIDRMLTSLERIPEGLAFVRREVSYFSSAWQNEKNAVRKDRLRNLLKKAGHSVSDPETPVAGP